MTIILIILAFIGFCVLCIIAKFAGEILNVLFDWTTDGCGCIIGYIILFFLIIAMFAMII